jgi:hypothetical protein
VCPRDAFQRAGLYRVTATVHANKTGTEHGLLAYTGDIEAKAPTLVRIQSSAEPYYPKEAPKAVATATLDAEEPAAGSSPEPTAKN